MKNRKLILAAAALALAVAIMAGIYFVTRPKGTEGSKDIPVVIVYANGSEKKLEYTTEHEYLVDVLLEHELVTGYASREYGYTIQSVDGITADFTTDGAYWALYVGDEYATVSAAGIALTDGGVYKLVYETY